MGAMLDTLSEQLLDAQNECTLCWSTTDGSPAATVVSFLYAKESLWMTTLENFPRIRAIDRNPKVALVVSGKGSKMGDTRCVSMRGTCIIHRDAQIRDWFFPLFSSRVLDKSKLGASMMAKSMNNDSNLVLQFTPEKVIPYDAQDMMNRANSIP